MTTRERSVHHVLAGEVLLLVIAVMATRGVAAVSGGYRTTFGLGGVSRQDWLPWITGVGMVFVARLAVVIVATVASHGRAARESSNIDIGHPGTGEIVALAVLVVVVAPITEEFVFRGILLRGLMRQLPFWPAALLSTLVFAGLHAYEVRTAVGAVTLVLVVGVLGLTNCYLVRITGRLTPGVMVHATFNALALAAAVAQSR